MQRVTFKIGEETLEAVDDEADEEGVSRSEYLRMIVDSRHDAARLRTEVDDLREEYEGKLAEARNRASAANQENERVDKLANYVENERAMQVKRQIRDDKRAEAGMLTRASWAIIGGPKVSDEELEERL